MEEPRRRALEVPLIQQWKEIEDLEANGAEDHFKSKREHWFLQAFSFLRDLPQQSHCWCGHKECILPLLEPFYNYFHETALNSSLRVLWRLLSREMTGCTTCVVQHHKAKEFYVSEFVEEVVTPLLDVICALDEERVALHMKELVCRFKTDTVDPKVDSYEVICIMFEMLMFPLFMNDAEVNEPLKPYLLYVEESHGLSLAAGQRYPVKEGPPFYGSKRLPKTIFVKEAVRIGLTTILSILETPAFLKGVMEKYPMFVSIVFNHVREATGVFWNALRCLKLLLE